jgi:hypothetical protein
MGGFLLALVLSAPIELGGARSAALAQLKR